MPEGSSAQDSHLLGPEEVQADEDHSFISNANTATTSDRIEDQLNTVINPHRSTFYIIVLTIVVGSLQLAWSTEFSEGTPFLLSLGISKQVLALIWIAGPISGTVGQPIVGIFSDKCNAAIGRRKPFILGGCAATAFSLWYLSHSTSIVGFFVRGADQDRINRIAVPFAAFGVYMLDFSISVIQASSRAFIVDCVPTDQQQIANAWAARSIGLFNIVGFWLGTVDLTRHLSFFGDTQFKVLATVAAIFLTVLTCAACWYVKERNPQTDIAIRAERRKHHRKLIAMGIDDDNLNVFTAIVSLFKQTVHSIRKLPPQIKIVCYAEFFAWIGYFPMLFYTTTYVGELYLYENGYSNPSSLPPEQRQPLLDEATRRGTLALLLHAITTLAVDLVLPLLVSPHSSAVQTHSCDSAWYRFKTFVQSVSVIKTWVVSHAVFILCTLSTFWIWNSRNAIIMFGFLGIPWGVALWAPFVLISEEVSRIKDIKARAAVVANQYHHHSRSRQFDDDDATFNPHVSPQLDSDFDYSSLDPSVLSGINGVMGKYSAVVHPKVVAKYDHMEHESGIILAIHNVYVAAPQIISSLASSLLFRLLALKKGEEGFDDSLGWVFRFGGLAAIGALVLSMRVKTNEQLMEEDWEESQA
ncbi:unnamed protein product [Kuraishia capsulata CBS 1993]|uniref:Sucrose transporter n=1 Tax=Kuraishia capsulata CBS 1993 TaxID=1382522 RepID=W6MY56_9ASCO|nr:uncharacterized protein KUCA_T00006045001 [Kuraishia capsulata CBS 1993]CDK30050.1 unnamed protein product [Kuraishia capsulata CBS 1993]